MRLGGDVIVLPGPEGRWLVHNVFARTWLAMESEGLDLLSAAGEGHAPENGGSRRYRVWDVQRFSSYDGLFADPTRLVRDPDAWPEPSVLGRGELIAAAVERFLLIADEEQYRARFASKKNLLDRERFGNFHQQLGQHLLLDRREKPDAWWVRQKFVSEGRVLGANLYRAIQDRFLRRYFQERLGPESTVVDLGCGTGYYTRLMAATGARVTGVDPNADFLGAAEEYTSEALRFVASPIGSAGDLDWLAAGTADYVFIIDALLFYFVPPTGDFRGDLDGLLGDVRRILRPGGRFVVVDPHGTFFLQSWLGDPDRPFTLLTEYRSRTYSIVPALATLVGELTSRGFAVTSLEELYSDPEHAATDPRGARFASEYPLWWVLELCAFD